MCKDTIRTEITSWCKCLAICGKAKLIFYIFCLLPLFKKRSCATGYSVFRADRTLSRWGPGTPGNHNDGRDDLTLINSDLSFLAAPFSNLTFSDPASDYLCVRINFQKRYPLLFFNIYPPPIRNTQLNSQPHTFSPKSSPELLKYNFNLSGFQHLSPRLGHPHLSIQLFSTGFYPPS